MDSPLVHVLHAIILSIILFVIMRFLLGQSQHMALNRSILIGAFAIIYMVLFGHGLPTHIKHI
jgi:hypothetical protein